MSIIKINKKPEFVAARCPECGGVLELDSSFEVAYCSNCKTQCFIKNVKKKKTKQTSLDKMIGFFERQQQIRRQDKIERKEKEEKEQKENDEFWKKYGWILLVIIVILFIFVGVMAIIEG